MVRNIIGISAYYHDSAAALLQDGLLTAAAQEERFTRSKHDAGFPANALKYCLDQGRLHLADIDCIVFYDKPLVKFERLLETYLAFAPRGFRSFVKAMPIWLKDKLYLKETLRRELAATGGCAKSSLPRLLFAEHHKSHAASAFYLSPFESAAVMCLDGVGEWATTSIWSARGNTITPLWQIDFPHSLGLLYSAFTYFTGFRVNSGEYKLMGLAPYGEPRYADVILGRLMDLKPDGTFRLDMSYFNYCTGLTMTNERFSGLFGGPAREPEQPLTQREMDIAASIQRVTEEVVLRLAETVRRETGETDLCLAGGVALNCVANGRLLRESSFDRVWVQPAAGDAGGAVGAAALGHYEYRDADRRLNGRQRDLMGGSFLGPSFSTPEIIATLSELGAAFELLPDDQVPQMVAALLAAENVVGWFQGRMEFGPRALGARSILGDPRSSRMQQVMNLKIKFRESFRPFAPAVLDYRASEYFDIDAESPFMMFVAPVRSERRIAMTDTEQNLFGIDRLNVKRSDIPAVTHVDYSARVQTVHEDTNPRFFRLLQAFDRLTGCGVLVNTSFNVRGEPIVCTPLEAYTCFMRTEMDHLVMENVLLSKENQDPAILARLPVHEFAPD